MQPSRRRFLSAGLVGLSPKTDLPIRGGFVDDTHAIGHRLRDRAGFPTPRAEEKIPVVIVGGGIAGLSAAWRLHKRGFRDFVVLEMERQAGGNSRWGENEVSAYPWAAHYVPVPGKKTALTRELFQDLGLLRDGIWDERHLCHSPQERLYLHGRWQEGLEPEIGATARDLEQYQRFEKKMQEFQATGEFTIPTGDGPRQFAALDRISMAAWMRQERFDSPYLNWYVDYACRDDYGARAADTSAWAGIHYFACREPDDKGPLTWPEGNGWIIKRLLERLGSHVRTASFVHRVERVGRGWKVLAGSTAFLARVVIYSAPIHLAPYIVEGAPPATGFQYSPWLTANLTLERLPQERGFPLAWDNVLYGSPTLGYVVATHQSLRTRLERTVWTFYWALAEGTPAQNRQLLLERDWNYWKEAILRDLSRAHPDIRSCVSRIDIMRLGHAMVRPAVGFVSSPERRRWLLQEGTLLYAVSDLSGLSLFEEAQFYGVRAANRALGLIG